MKTLYIRAPRYLHRHITLLDVGLNYFEGAGCVPPEPDGSVAAIKRKVPDDWVQRLSFLAKLHGISNNRAAVAALQYATRSALNPRPAIPPDA